MSNKSDNLEIVHEGWLTKSPPTKRIWRARWRKRWFVLRHSGELPGQYFLCYYTDRNCRTLKGTIDLDQCEQVDAGLRFENNKQKYQHMFDVRTPKRTYYLAAETEADMNKWVDCVCQVCGLKVFSQDDHNYPYAGEETFSVNEGSSFAADSPPVSPSSTASGPYIPISECITGKPITNSCSSTSNLLVKDDYYDSPRKLLPPSNLELRASGSTTPPLQSPGTDAESVFTDEELSNPCKPNVNWETFPRPSDSSVEEARHGFVVSAVGRKYTKPTAPPRPPKPQHLVLQDSTDSHTYLNLDNVSPKDLSDGDNDTYDFPRSHLFNGEQENIDPVPLPKPRHCYTNAAPVQVVGNVFRYDFTDQEPPSPHSESSPLVQYSNVPSPAGSSSNPPAVNRELKPGRKTSDSVSNEPSPQPSHPPNIDRKLKPVGTKVKELEGFTLKLSAPPPGRAEYTNHSTRPRLSPSPTSKTVSDNSDSEVWHDDLEQVRFASFNRGHTRGLKKEEIQYLDLDLDSTENGTNAASPPAQLAPVPKSPPASSGTVYKTVDFLKTEAFNRTRQKVEEERKQGSSDLI